MASTYSTNLGIELIANGEQSGTWGTTTNTNLGTLIEEAISGYTTQAMSDGGDTTISIPNGASGTARNMYLRLTGTLTAARNLVVPSNKKLYFIHNDTSGGFAVTVKVSGQTGVSVPNGAKMVLVSNGTDIVEAVTHFNTFTAGSLNATPVGNTTASSGAFTTLSASGAVSGTGFTNYFASPPAIGSTAPAAVTATALTAQRVIVNGTTVPSNGIYQPAANELGVATSTTNRLTVKTGLVMAGATGGSSGDMGAGTINATGVFINGVAVGTGSGSVSNVTVGTPLAVTNGSTTPNITLGTVPAGQGGTGRTSLTSGNLLVGAGTSAVNYVAPGTNGQVLTVVGGAWAAATPASGGVTSVTATSPLSSSGGSTPDISLGTVTASKGGTGRTSLTSGNLLVGAGTSAVNYVPPGTNGQVLTVVAGAWTAATPTSGGVTSVTASAPLSSSGGSTPDISLGTVPAGQGGTGQNTYTTGDILYASNSNTLSKLAGVAVGNALISGGTAAAPSWGKVGLTTHVTGTLAVGNGGTGTTSSTGSGSNVLSTNPSISGATLTSPALGTPTSGTLSSCTVDGTNAVGFKNIPQTTSTTLASTSVGKHHYVSAGVTINTGVFSAGDAFMIVNSGTGNITITQGTSVTLRLAGTATTGNRTLAQKGIASVLCVAAGDFIVSGAGVT